jgi:hypothetical protein
MKEVLVSGISWIVGRCKSYYLLISISQQLMNFIVHIKQLFSKQKHLLYQTLPNFVENKSVSQICFPNQVRNLDKLNETFKGTSPDIYLFFF